MNFRAPLASVAGLRAELSDTLTQHRATLAELEQLAGTARIVLCVALAALLLVAVAVLVEAL